MLLDILKVLVPFASGGLAGAILNEWFRRRGGKLQAIPLIERVNRLVSPDLKGFTLARVTGDPGSRKLEEITNVREYQLTLRNTATIHLQDAEIQFEFPTEDVEAWASRPALSKTAPVPVEAVIADPWKKGFRWRIPHLPSSDSIEFSFRAVNPSSDEYEVALYKTDRVVIEKSKGELKTAKNRTSNFDFVAFSLVLTIAITTISALVLRVWLPDTGNKFSSFGDGQCTFTMVSTYERLGPNTWPWSSGPWQISHLVVNVGGQKCTVQSAELTSGPVTVLPGESVKRTAYIVPRPKLIEREMSFGIDNPTRKVTVGYYGDPQQR